MAPNNLNDALLRWEQGHDNSRLHCSLDGSTPVVHIRQYRTPLGFIGTV